MTPSLLRLSYLIFFGRIDLQFDDLLAASIFCKGLEWKNIFFFYKPCKIYHQEDDISYRILGDEKICSEMFLYVKKITTFLQFCMNTAAGALRVPHRRDRVRDAWRHRVRSLRGWRRQRLRVQPPGLRGGVPVRQLRQRDRQPHHPLELPLACQESNGAEQVWNRTTDLWYVCATFIKQSTFCKCHFNILTVRYTYRALNIELLIKKPFF
jgi:hypothetical protein